MAVLVQHGVREGVGEGEGLGWVLAWSFVLVLCRVSGTAAVDSKKRGRSDTSTDTSLIESESSPLATAAGNESGGSAQLFVVV
jgi:hypothetical protein